MKFVELWHVFWIDKNIIAKLLNYGIKFYKIMINKIMKKKE